jgi:hypothetical protein
MLAGARGTLDAVQAAGPGLGATFDEFPPTETATSDALVGLRPALISVASVMRRMQPGAQLLPTAIPAVDKLLATGSRTLPSLRPFAARLRVSLQSLTRLSRDPPTAGSVRKLTELAGALDVLLARMVPAQLSCNVLGVFGVQQPYMVTSLGGGEVPFLSNSVAAHAAQGEQLQNAQPSADMHSNPAPNENASECEAGNEPYKPTEQALSNPPGLQSRVVPHTLPPLEARQHTLQGTP